MGELVRLEVDGGIGTIRLDRPPMNALDAQVQEEIRAAAVEATERRDVAAVVVYGGEKVFAAGADIKQMQQMSYTDMVDRSSALQSSLGAVARIPKPTVAAITGYALGGGLELALCCDFRVCGDNAKVGQPEILLGIIPGAGGTQRLPRLVGPSRAKDLIFTGRQVNPQPTNIYPLLDHARRVAQTGLARDITIEESFDPSLPPVLADNDALLQIIINLLKNAAEALDDVKKPRILISTAYRHGLAVDAGPGQPRRGLPIELRVIDNGPGAPADIADHLFDPFVSGKPEGQGLGLALVDKLVRDMGGMVQYVREGEPDMTVFRMLLPRAPQ